MRHKWPGKRHWRSPKSALSFVLSVPAFLLPFASDTAKPNWHGTVWDHTYGLFAFFASQPGDGWRKRWEMWVAKDEDNIWDKCHFTGSAGLHCSLSELDSAVLYTGWAFRNGLNLWLSYIFASLNVKDMLERLAEWSLPISSFTVLAISFCSFCFWSPFFCPLLISQSRSCGGFGFLPHFSSSLPFIMTQSSRQRDKWINPTRSFPAV